jgi:hypothetical protein
MTSLAKTTFVNIPIVNIKLPVDIIGNQQHSISLSRALTQTDHFIEHRMVVPKNKSVIYSNEVAFFYANRRFPAINFGINTCISMRYVNIPASIVNTSSINNTNLVYDDRIRIGRDQFQLRSVVMLQRPHISGLDVATGCSAAIIVSEYPMNNSAYGIITPNYIHYNPVIASIQYLDPTQPAGQSQYTANTPITFIDEHTMNPERIGFRDEAQLRGTIFFYVKLKSQEICD